MRGSSQSPLSEILKIRFSRNSLCIVAIKLTFEKIQGVVVGYNARGNSQSPL